MHARFKMWVEWGIKGLKCKWRRLMKRFDFTKPKYNTLFKVVALLTNILHKCHMEFTYEVINKHIPWLTMGGMEIITYRFKTS
jgi:hypothetical protein